MGLASAERAGICEAFLAAGPDRPTLCAGWTTRDLLAHLLVRERQPLAAPGILVSALAPITDRAMARYASAPWRAMVEELRGGAPIWSPYRIGAVDAFVNAAEFFVHHEDVRRGEPGWEPRPADPRRDRELWRVLGRVGRALYRRSPAGVVLRRPDGAQHALGAGAVTLVGEPGELLLHAFGRDAVHVDLEGPPDDVAAFTAAARGL